jgi:hypothetical protein
MNKETIKSIHDVAVQIIKDEHEDFVLSGGDNYEHIPRMKRISESISTFLRAQGVPESKCLSVASSLIATARDLFVQEWIKPLDHDEEPPEPEEAVEKFNDILSGNEE